MKHKRTTRNMRWATFERDFKPVQNHIDKNAAFDGCGFETYGSELEHVRKVLEEKPLCVWTIVDCNGKLYLSSGYHHVNRMLYIITEVPALDGIFYTATT